MNILDRYAPIWLAGGLAVWVESFITIEWTYPYCLSQSDGPSYAPQGMPLPYQMASGAVSLEHEVMLHVYVLDVLLLALLLFPLVRWLMSGRRSWLRSLLGVIGCVLLVSQIAMTVLLISIGAYRPAASLDLDGYYQYSEFRPVRIGARRSSTVDCTPSKFWFPGGWKSQ